MEDLIAAVKRIAEALEKIEVRLASIETSQEKLVERPFWGADSTGRRNTRADPFSYGVLSHRSKPNRLRTLIQT